MSEKEDFVKYWISLEMRLHYWAKANINSTVNKSVIWQAVSVYVREKYKLELLNDVFFHRIPDDELREYLLTIDLNLFREQIEISTGDVDFTHLTFERAGVKVNGRIWRVYKYDKDPFPSNPHAHELQDCLKLNLSNGVIYKFKQRVGKIKTKELMDVREALEGRGVSLPMLTK